MRITTAFMMTAFCMSLMLLVGGCSPSAEAQYREQAAGPAPAGQTPVGVELSYLFENVQSAPYFPFEGLSGVAWGEDGLLVICDEARGKVHGLDPRTRRWFEFDHPPANPFRPVSARVDGFKVLVLDIASRTLFRFQNDGVYQDRLVDFHSLDPAFNTAPSAFDLDVDGRLVVTDGGEEQVLMLDSFMTLTSRVGNPGPHQEQFEEPSGVTYLPNGGFMVSDRGNRRLQRFNRLGYWTATLGGQFDTNNPYVTPQGLDADRWGNVFVADPAAGVVHVLDARGHLLFDLGPGLDLKATPLGPIDVAVGPNQQLAVTDRLRGAVLVYNLVYE